MELDDILHNTLGVFAGILLHFVLCKNLDKVG